VNIVRAFTNYDDLLTYLHFYFRSPRRAFPSDDEDDVDDDCSACSCCRCDLDPRRPADAPQQTGNGFPLPVSTAELSTVAPISPLTDVNGRWTDCGGVLPSTVASGGTGLTSFFAFLRSGGLPWRSRTSSESVAAARRGPPRHTLSTLPPCTCGLGVHYDPPLSVAQQVPRYIPHNRVHGKHAT